MEERRPATRSSSTAWFATRALLPDQRRGRSVVRLEKAGPGGRKRSPTATAGAAPRTEPARSAPPSWDGHIDHKGLDLLIDACGLIRNAWASAGASLVIHGPDWRQRRRTENQNRPQASRKRRRFKGPCPTGIRTDSSTQSTYSFTSRTERAPDRRARSTRSRRPLPVDAQHEHGQEVVAAGAGWLVEATRQGVAQGLLKLLDLSAAELEIAGRNARYLAEDRYTWPMIAERSVEAYRRFAA